METTRELGIEGGVKSNVEGDALGAEELAELRALARVLGGDALRPEPSRAASSATAEAPSVPEPREPGHELERAARFTLEAALESTPLGTLHPARDRAQDGRAVRVLRLGARDSARLGLAPRLEERAQRIASLAPRVFPRLLAVELAGDGHLLLASEALEGESLRACLRRRGTLPPRHALEVARQVLLALESLHPRGLVHGALAAECVWLASRVPWSASNPFGVRVCLLDAGVGALLDEAPLEDGEAPRRELAEVACLLAEMLAGTRLESAAAWRAAGARLAPRDVSALLRHALGPLHGFADAASFRAALEALPSVRPTRRIRRASALILLLLVSGAGALLWRERASRAAERAGFESELRAARDESRWPLACAALDAFLRHLEEGDPEGARTALAAARATPGLSELGFGTGYLEELLSVRETLARATHAPAPLERAQTLLEARSELASARASGARFELQGARWLALDSAPRPARAEHCAGWRASLERELAQLSAGLDRTLAERWDALDADGNDDPSEVLLLARWFADERLSAYAARLPAGARALREELAPFAPEATRALVPEPSPER